ncbi:MAG: energy-coupling factor ABC transporter ATP-binding protein [Bryobacteraceae bacterium]|nr:energy-coupling factor ABC transporter ATP-binding protein [Bryobacteraceae bacterium]MDW8376556.1 ABC transporter ATP-binding protein [Bryobacterales bacterium]
MQNENQLRGCSVEADRLVFCYGAGRPALNGLTLSVAPGERLGIIGASGAGKSTFLLHLNGVLFPLSGEVRIGGEVVSQANLARIRSRVGIVFQNPDDQLFTPTVEEEVAFGPLNSGCDPEETRERVQSALRDMRLEGYEKRSTLELSFGEKRRVALATVLAMRPQVIAFDEPFANLDAGMVEQVVRRIQQLDATVIVVSQEILPVLAAVDRLAVFDQGRVAALGPALEIARDRTLLRRCGLDFHFLEAVCRKVFFTGGES